MVQKAALSAKVVQCAVGKQVRQLAFSVKYHSSNTVSVRRGFEIVDKFKVSCFHQIIVNVFFMPILLAVSGS